MLDHALILAEASATISDVKNLGVAGLAIYLVKTFHEMSLARDEKEHQRKLLETSIQQTETLKQLSMALATGAMKADIVGMDVLTTLHKHEALGQSLNRIETGVKEIKDALPECNYVKTQPIHA